MATGVTTQVQGFRVQGAGFRGIHLGTLIVLVSRVALAPEGPSKAATEQSHPAHQSQVGKLGPCLDTFQDVQCLRPVKSQPSRHQQYCSLGDDSVKPGCQHFAMRLSKVGRRADRSELEPAVLCRMRRPANHGRGLPVPASITIFDCRNMAFLPEAKPAADVAESAMPSPMKVAGASHLPPLRRRAQQSTFPNFPKHQAGKSSVSLAD